MPGLYIVFSLSLIISLVSSLNSDFDCTSNDDCEKYNNFCDGPAVCDLVDNKCYRESQNYIPCQDTSIMREYSDLGLQQQPLQEEEEGEGEGEEDNGNPKELPIKIICIEHLSMCVESIQCETDSDCSDGKICNGEEGCNRTCVGDDCRGTCYSKNNLSLTGICGGENYYCFEEVGCIQKDVVMGPGPIVVIVSSATLIIILLISMFVINGIFIWKNEFDYNFRETDKHKVV